MFHCPPNNINYYPYGSEMRMTDPTLMVIESFSGKELDGQNGLNMYDFGARMFDVAGVPIWTSVDPLAEKNTSITPYSYCNGDPVNRFDPDGKDYYRNDEGDVFWQEGSEQYINYEDVIYNNIGSSITIDYELMQITYEQNEIIKMEFTLDNNNPLNIQD